MPLFELFRLAKGKLDPTQEKLTLSAVDSSPLPGNDFAELTLENGQVLLQGQCNYGDKKSPALNTNSFTPCSSKPGGEDNAGAGKMGNPNCGPSVFPCTVPSAEISLNQEDDMVPWLHYPISGSLSSDYNSDFLSELPGVVVNKNSVGNNCGSAAKYGQGPLFRESLFSSLQSVNRLEEGTRARTSNMRMLPSSLPLQSQTPSASSLKLQRADFTPSANTSSIMNSSDISRSTAVLRSHNDCDNKMAGLDLLHKESVWGSDMDAAVDVKNTSNPSPIVSGSALGKGLVLSRQISVPQQRVDLNVPDGKSSQEPVSLQKVEAIHPRDALRGNKQSWRPSRTRRGLADGEKTLEPIGGSSSVCSGNGVERASDDPKKYSFKRKSYETEESDGCSEDVEEELLSAKKQTTGRDSPRRTRAAEVHNLSERRRRDRINEKMRALQELIPQCNKVDKASMLDEAIKYIKTLKLQLQMVTMGVGLYMMPTMLPTGIQLMGHMPHYPNMGIGMIPGMHVMGGSMYGLRGQGFPLPMPHTPLVPFSGRPVTNSATGLNNTGAVPMPVENQGLATVSSGRESARSMDIQSVQNTISSCLTEKRPSLQFAVAPRSGRALDKKGTSEVADCTSPKDPKMACR